MKESKMGLIVLFLIYFVLVMLSYLEIKSVFEYNDLKEEYLSICLDDNLNKNDNYCSIDVTDLPSTPDTLTVFYNIIYSNILMNLPMLAPILIVIFSSIYLNKLMKSKYLYYYVQRKNYKCFIKNMIINSYKYVLVVPFIVLLVYLLSLSISNHGPNELTEIIKVATFKKIYYNTPYFLVLYAINIMIMWLFYINIILIIQSKNRKLIFNIIEFIIIYFILEIIFEELPSNYWLFDIYTLGDEISINKYLLTSSLYFIISFTMLIIVYKNKEKVLNRIGEQL